MTDSIHPFSGLDIVIKRALLAFQTEALNGSWSGRREREAISLFVMGYLSREVRPGGLIADITQIAIECPVPQLCKDKTRAFSGRNSSKLQVCKDIVIWPEPRMTCWDEKEQPTIPPCAIMEWKFGRSTIYEPDVLWLKAYSEAYPRFTGYAVTGNRPGCSFSLSCTRIEAGKVEPRWLHIVDPGNA